jgi:glycosyltransferase involved in cell wall biosynthesis
VRNGNGALVVLTIAYPFGRSSETFLDAELPILARRFEEVVVVPSSRDEYVRRLPPGVRCETVLADRSRRDVLREAFRHPVWLARQYLRALLEEHAPAAYLWHPVSYAAVVGSNILKFHLLEKLIEREELHDAVFYDYWLANSTLALSWLRRRGVIKRAVARAHLVDLYDEQAEGGAVPFRAFGLASLDHVFPISLDGLSYLAARHPEARAKLTLSRLGVEAPQAHAPTEPRERPRVVSCGGLVPGKRVEMIPQVLARIGRTLNWVHFGDGPCRRDVEEAAKALPPSVSWDLAGHVDHDRVLDFYATNRVDLFLSLSLAEGVPVSMMEAISFGVPLLATAVGGVPEIVNERTGRLVGVDDSAESIALAAQQLLDGNGPSRDEIIAFFKSTYEAERNFGEFADALRAS